MMKKRLISLLAAFLLSVPVAVQADGNLTVVSQGFFLPEDDSTGHFYAKVENAGSEPAILEEGIITAYDEEREVVDSNDYAGTCPSYMILNPGEYAYVDEYLFGLDNISIGNVKFTIEEGKAEDGVEYIRIPCEISYDFSDENELYYDVTFTNDTDEMIDEFSFAAALYDEEGQIFYTNHYSYTTIGVHPGSTITVKQYVGDYVLEEFEEKGITPASIDAYVCYIKSE